jgi:glycosyltransferase involved in cell wall biosynthesis
MQPYSRLRLRTMARELFLDLDRLSMATLDEVGQNPDFDVFIAMGNTLLPPVAALGRRNIYICQFPFPMTAGMVEHNRSFWSGYDELVTYSEFARSHAQGAMRRLGMPEKPIGIISPPVNLLDHAGAVKDNIIVAVGRIFIGDHCKRHDFMIEVFRSMLEKGRQDIELHIAGALHPEPVHRDYLLKLQEMARGLPVFFHLNVSREDLEALYRRALVYWHAAGVGVDISATPERCEHFGITVVEAASAGCVPIVFGAGGPAEFVEHGRTGFHFKDGAELAELTNRVVMDSDKPWVADMAAAATARAARYEKNNFVRTWRQLGREPIGRS